MENRSRRPRRSDPLREILSELRRAQLQLGALLALWQARDGQNWASEPEIYRSLGEQILKKGEPLLAYDVVRQGLEDVPGDVRLRQLQALALARSGASERAGTLLQQLLQENHADGETLGMLARTYKDRAAQAATPRQRRALQERAAETYALAHKISGDYWTGINAATTALLTGRTTLARKLAQQVHQNCARELRRKRGDRYWLLATLGEAALVLENWEAAEEHYTEAGETAGRRFGDLQATRRNARLLLAHWQRDSSTIEKALRIPPVAVFAGHNFDRAERPQPRFPVALEKAVAAEMQQRLAQVAPAIGYASAACGADLLFLERMLAAGGEVVVVLPYQEKDFLADSYQHLPQARRWRERAEHVLRRATRIVTASNQLLEIGGVAYDYANQLILGLASIRATQLETEVVALAVWNGETGDGPGGTASAVARWKSLGLPTEIISLPSAKLEARARKKIATLAQKERRPRSPAGRTRRRGFGSQIHAMLFADAANFSQLREEELPAFVQFFLGKISRIIARSDNAIVSRNTWGDGIYLVFERVREAGHFALDLGELVRRTKWQEHGLPADLSLRIGVHAGPVYECNNPIKNTHDFFGAHVSRTARIEPITPPGQVYASEAFAALAAAQNVRDLRFEYAGQVPMAKGAGVYPMYHMNRRLA